MYLSTKRETVAFASLNKDCGVIKQVVEESWEELLQCAKDLIDARLEDGKKIFTKFFMIASPLNVTLKKKI